MTDELIYVPLSNIKISINFQAPKHIVKYLRQYVDDIKVGRIDRVPDKYRGIFDPVKLEEIKDDIFICRDGNHRLPILKALGLDVVKAYLVDDND